MDITNKNYIQNYAEILLDFIFDLLDKENCFGVNHAEFIFQKMAAVISENSFLKKWFIIKVDYVLNADINNHSNIKRPKQFVNYDLVLYIAHVFRWEEFKTLAGNCLNKKLEKGDNMMNWNLASSILDAIKDDWEDKDLYNSLK